MENVSSHETIGEMAHIIADAPGGPRGSLSRDSEFLRSYENLILLCPNHHAQIDADVTTYTPEALIQLKAEHEAWVRSRFGEGLAVGPINCSYIIVNGDRGLREMMRGQDSPVFGRKGYNFRILKNEAFEWARTIQEASLPWQSWPERLDWETLKRFGAPIDPLRPSFLLRDELLAHSIDPAQIIRTEFAWVQVTGSNCQGTTSLEILSRSGGLTKEQVPAWLERLRGWVESNVSTRYEGDELYALLPVLRVKEASLYCLQLEPPEERSGALLGLYSGGRLLHSIVMDERSVLVPLGCVFEDSDANRWLNSQTQCGLLDAQYEGEPELDEVEYATRIAYSEGSTFPKMVGPQLRVEQFAFFTHGSQGSVSRIDVRSPYRLKEYINCYFYGGSCPEVFFRKSRGKWQYAGAVLKGALGIENAGRSEMRVTEGLCGDEIDVLILEVPQEIACVSGSLSFQAESGHGQMIHFWSDAQLSFNKGILSSFTVPENGSIILQIEGYFERVSSDRPLAGQLAQD